MFVSVCCYCVRVVFGHNCVCVRQRQIQKIRITNTMLTRELAACCGLLMASFNHSESSFSYTGCSLNHKAMYFIYKGIPLRSALSMSILAAIIRII